MNLKNLNNIFLILLILSVILLPVLVGASILNFSEEDNFAGEDDFLIINSFSAAWMQFLFYQVPGLLGLGMSIFVLFVVYVGGRSKNKRFNDRIIDLVSILIAAFLKTARIRAVFNFLDFLLHPFYTNNCLIRVSHPILISNHKRSTKL